MNLSEQIDAGLKEAMRARDSAATEKGGAEGELDDAEATQVIRKQVKQRQDSIESFEKGGRPELAEKEKGEITLLSTYLPTALSEAEIASLVRETITEIGATSKAQMGAVMKALGPKIGGRADGRTLSQEVQRQLA
jgi:uncharacterized protein YqeY